MIPTEDALRRALCDAITAAAGKNAPNATGQCTIKVQGNSLTVRVATPPKVAVVEMKYLYGSSLSFTVTRSRFDDKLLKIAPGGDMTIENLGAHLFDMFVTSLRVV